MESSVRRYAIRRIVCAWCGKVMRKEPDVCESEDYDSHGICPACNQKHFGKYLRGGK